MVVVAARVDEMHAYTVVRDYKQGNEYARGLFMNFIYKVCVANMLLLVAGIFIK